MDALAANLTPTGVRGSDPNVFTKAAYHRSPPIPSTPSRAQIPTLSVYKSGHMMYTDVGAETEMEEVLVMSKRAHRRQRRMIIQQLREGVRTQRAQNRALRHTSQSELRSAKTWLLASGLSLPLASRFAGAFSRSMLHQGLGQVKVKLRHGSRRCKYVPVKLYDRTTFMTRLATYRPRDKEAALKFNQIAA